MKLESVSSSRPDIMQQERGKPKDPFIHPEDRDETVEEYFDFDQTLVIALLKQLAAEERTSCQKLLKKAERQVDAVYKDHVRKRRGKLEWATVPDGQKPKVPMVQLGTNSDGEELFAGRALHTFHCLPGMYQPNILSLLVPHPGGQVDLTRHFQVLTNPSHISTSWAVCKPKKAGPENWHPTRNSIIVGCMEGAAPMPKSGLIEGDGSRYAGPAGFGFLYHGKIIFNCGRVLYGIANWRGSLLTTLSDGSLVSIRTPTKSGERLMLFTA